jgi:polyhydroxybutyrate depolymerase
MTPSPPRKHRRPARLLPALLVLTLSLLACTRSFRAAPDPASDSTHTLTFDGVQRSYLLHVPSSYDGTKPVPLVLDFHGGGGQAENQMRVSGFNGLADEQGFLVAYPNGTGRLGDAVLTWNGGTCCGYAVNNNVDDVGFVRAMLAEIQATYKIDSKRIFATGLSNGGILSYRLACEASDLIAAIGPVAGTQNIVPCEPSAPVSVIHFHGTDDRHLPYDGGVGDQSLVGVDFASVQQSIDFWVKFDSCPSSPATTTAQDVRHDAYGPCLNGTAVELYTIIGGGHAWPGSEGPAWPGGDAPTQSVSATRVIWDFFAAHPKP